ncbi:MAG: MFS transporter [Alcaligenaceae bacterium]|nr:MFS transporter [Alcaligenaceae bacterium]
MKSPNIYTTPGFLPFLFARLFSVFAMQIQAIVVGWQIYDITRDPMALAYVGLAQFIPMVLCLPYAGDLIDRLNRKAVLALSWIVSAICSGLLLWLSYMGGDNLLGYYLALIFYGAARAFSGPALQSLLPQIVPRDRLAQALATNSMLMKTAVITGPILGGFLYAYVGGMTYAVCCLCFVLGILLLYFVPILYSTQHEGPSQDNTGVWQRFSEGLRFIWKKPIILGTISLDLFAVLLGGVVALLPIYAQEVLHVDSTGLGLLRSAMAIGEIATGLYLSRRPFNQQVGKVMFSAVALFGLANLVFAFSTIFWLSFAALMVAGAADMISVYIRSALVQFSTPDYLRGRVNAVNMLFISSSNELGSFRAGSSAALIGAVPAAVFGGVCTLVVVAGMAWRFKPLRKVNRFEDAEHVD